MENTPAIKKEYFMCIVGFYGDNALVDKKLMARIKKMSVEELIKNSFLYSAVCSALFDSIYHNSDKGVTLLCNHFEVTFDVLLRQFGVNENILTEQKYAIKFI